LVGGYKLTIQLQLKRGMKVHGLHCIVPMCTIISVGPLV